MLFLKADNVVNLLPLSPIMFTVAPATAAFVEAVAGGDGKMHVGSAGAKAKGLVDGRSPAGRRHYL